MCVEVTEEHIVAVDAISEVADDRGVVWSVATAGRRDVEVSYK